ncbi:tRNA-dihydrouridine(20/20a) synthase [BD1-7 clade bacterium]|uniref:tRNA-dihydrouridine(20/20a) synthase n=1 Tax=BD1-7 clade bacterium TaxID=2029982 RepID=A0A5S9NTX0_9GAMM|nr:tRNA-dihydrouridine(20/20a) synthase [BD1-7 clade bacterium]CAA0094086.1 tRNA-dihydrouridine(20/20a) synthase [BD1-7 clade bacterium]
MPETTASTAELSHRFCVAPMIDWTDRHARYFMRLLSKHALLYTEMITTGAILHGDAHRFLRFSDEEHPLALQLGGSDPKALAECTRIASSDFTYDEINLNVGCPSDRVQSGMFGACLMARAPLVAECFEAMQAETHRPVTIKCRTGIDDLDSLEFLEDFIGTVAEAGCKTFIIHARKAWLSGLSPKENREIPPLHYDRVYHIKERNPELNVIINGGITEMDACLSHLSHCDGVMVGRESYNNPYFLAQVDAALYGDDSDVPSRHDAVKLMYPYIENALQSGVKLNHITRHMLGIFNGISGAKRFRRYISENAHKPGADLNVLKDALSLIPE